MSKISATKVAHSKNESGNELFSVLVTFPRYILAELNTHRMLSKNSASSRAIPFEKLLKSVQENPFIPIAWQKDHSGMQGTEYFTAQDEITSLTAGHLLARDYAVERAVSQSSKGLTKQLCNRLLEPFMWHTVLITASEWENFFALRCPQYVVGDVGAAGIEVKTYRSRKDVLKDFPHFKDQVSEVWWLKMNKGAAEIHMMALAEAIWDSYNDSVPNELKDDQWHIVYEDKINEMFGLTQSDLDTDGIPFSVKIGCIMAARTSYTVVGTELSDWTKEKYAAKCNDLTTAKPLHASPFEHCAKAMSIADSGNFKGFVQYRKMLPNENITK